MRGISRRVVGRGVRKGRIVKVAFWNVAGIRRKDREFWREVTDWDIVVMSETWLEKGGWEMLRGKMPRDYKWEVQLVSRKNRKGKAIGEMLMGIREGIEVMEAEGGREMDGMMRMVRLGEKKWRIVGVEHKWKLE